MGYEVNDSAGLIFEGHLFCFVFFLFLFAMDLHPLADPPRLRTLDVSTQQSQSNEDGDIFVNLHARVSWMILISVWTCI